MKRPFRGNLLVLPSGIISHYAAYRSHIYYGKSRLQNLQYTASLLISSAQ